MEHYYNQRLRTRARLFHPGQPVLVRNCYPGRPQSLTSWIECRLGQVLSNVRVCAIILPDEKPAETSGIQLQKCERLLPLDILLDIFNLHPGTNVGCDRPGRAAQGNSN
ncbi:unnamed protein product, partial [Dicrocoelium dendriticum]